MSQPSVASYFNTRKRAAVEDLKAASARKVLLVEENDALLRLSKSNAHNEKNCELKLEKQNVPILNDSLKIVTVNNNKTSAMARKAAMKQKPRTKTIKDIPNQRNIEEVLYNMSKKECTISINQTDVADMEKTHQTPPSSPMKKLNAMDKIVLTGNEPSLMELKKSLTRTPPSSPMKKLNAMDRIVLTGNEPSLMEVEKSLTRTPPSSPLKKLNAMDKIALTGNEPSLMELKKSLTRSSRLAELKASMTRFKDTQKRLEEAEKRTEEIASTSPSLKTFKTIELEVISPNKICSPEKSYLSPKKDLSVRKNLFNLLSPTKTKQSLAESPKKIQHEATEKNSLTLPFKYRRLAEILRSIDSVSQIMYNRKETITFRKLKPAVEEMLKRNFYEKHLSQIKNLCPEFFNFNQTKLKMHGAGNRQEHWELIVTPNVESDTMTADVLLTRRRKFFNVLIEKVKFYHNEFLLTLDPSLHISMNNVKRWHPEFDIEKVPDVECAELPHPPVEEKFTTGKEVLEKARIMFNCNTRMEQALERLHQARKNNLETVEQKPPSVVTSALKGIPKALLEKVRERQAAKALESMTRSAIKEKEVQLYSRLPEIARLTRNLFVAEKRSVLHIDAVIDKLSNSFRTYMTKLDLENHLRIISKEVPTWLVFHEIRHSTFIKITKNADLSLVINKLETLAKEKDNS